MLTLVSLLIVAVLGGCSSSDQAAIDKSISTRVTATQPATDVSTDTSTPARPPTPRNDAPVPPTATPTPRNHAPLPETATPSIITAKEKLVGIGFNIPTKGSVIDAKQEYEAGLDISKNHRDRFSEIQESLNNVLDGYPNYLFLAFNQNGTDLHTQPVCDRLLAANFDQGKVNTVDELIDRQACLAGSNAGVYRTSTTNPFSICIANLAGLQNPHSTASYEELQNRPERALGRLALSYAHEYFHHYQRAHAPDRGLDYQQDREHPETTVEAPRWWIEGAAVTFQNAWYKSNWYSLSFFEDKNWSDVDVSIANITNPYLYKEVRKSIQGSIPRDQWIDGYSPDWYLSDLENTYDRGWSCRYANTMATAYIAYKTSYKAVWIDIPQNYYELGWWGAFEKDVGLTKQEFFDEYNQFQRSGNPEDEPPIGWSPPDGPISEYANLCDIIPAS